MKSFFTRKNRYLFMALGMAAFAACGFFAHTVEAQSALDPRYQTQDDWLATGFVRAIAIFAFLIAKWLLMIAGIAFNLATFHGVFDFKNLTGVNSAGMLASWSMLRDIANIGLIFGFVMIGMATILDIHGYDVKKTLPRLIIFAVLLNFSLLASQAIIDAANVTSAALYTTAAGNCDSASTIQDCALDANYGPSGFIIQTSGVSSFWYTTPNEFQYGDIPTAIMASGLAIFMAVTAMVLLAAAIMLVIRAAVLVFLMITSPIGFAGLALPPLASYANTWWKMLLSQSFFAPVLLVLIMISLKVLESVRAVMGAGEGGLENSLGAVLANTNPSNASALMVFAMSIAFMVLALVAAKRMGAYGADFAISLSRKTISAPFALTTRSTVGRGAAGLTKRYEKFMGGKFATKSGLQTFARVTGADDVIAGTMKKVSDAKFGGFRSFDEKKKADETRKKHLKHVADLGHASAEIKEGIQAAKGGDVSKLARILQKMSMAELKQTEWIEKASGGIEHIARALSTDKFEKLLDDKDTPEETRVALLEGRYGKFGKDVRAGTVDQAEVRTRSAKELALFARADAEGYKILANSVRNAAANDFRSILSDEQLEAVIKLDISSPEQKQVSRDNKFNDRIKIWAKMPAASVERRRVPLIIERMTPKQKAALDTDVYFDGNGAVRADVAQRIRGADIERFNTEATFNGPQRNGLMTYFRGLPQNSPQRADIAQAFTNPYTSAAWGTYP